MKNKSLLKSLAVLLCAGDDLSYGRLRSEQTRHAQHRTYPAVICTDATHGAVCATDPGADPADGAFYATHAAPNAAC